MKIRTDFVTNSSSSSFVTYRLTNSEFCKYLYEQMQKNGFTYEKHSTIRPASSLSIDEDSLYGEISCSFDGTSCQSYAPEVYDGSADEYCGSDLIDDIKLMSKLFLDVIGEFVALEKVDDPERLYDAFVRDLDNGAFDCYVYLGTTD